MKIHKLIFTVILLFGALSAFPFGGATIRYLEKGKTVKTENVTLPEVEPGVWRLRIPAKDIPRNTVVQIIFDEGTAQKGEDGYIVTPDSQMATFALEKGGVSRAFTIPLTGMKTPRACYAAIVKGLRFEGSTQIKIENGVYEHSINFNIADDQIPGGKAYEDIIVDYYKLEGDNANYSGMGRAYRKYLLDNKIVRPLRERVKNNPNLKYTAESIFVRLKNGIKNNKDKIAKQTPENEPKLIVMKDFDNCMKIMRELKSMGLDDVEMCLVGWNAGGFDGRYPQLLPIPEEFGGEKKLRQTIATARELGYQITNHICNTDAYEVSDCWDEKYIARRADGKMRHQLILAGGRAYYPCQKMHVEMFMDENNKTILDLGFKGTQHNDVYTCILPYPCFDPRHPCTKADTGKYMGMVAAASQKAHGGFGSEGPSDTFAGNLDFALYVWAYPNHCGKKSEVLNCGPVPLWQIVYHGIILSNPYWDTIDPTLPKSTAGTRFGGVGEKWKKVLKMVELNGRPVFYFYITDKNLSMVKEMYDIYEPMKYLQYEFMEDHRELSPGVFLTTFSDASRVLVNYSDSDFNFEGNIVKSRGYKLLPGGMN